MEPIPIKASKKAPNVYFIPLCIICLYPLIFSQFGDVYLLTSYGSIAAFVKSKTPFTKL